jgi:predicted transcriptional regulator
MVKNKRVQVTFSKDQWELITRLKDSFGNKDADVVRNIVLAWLAEKSIISENTKKKLRGV